MIFLIDHNLKGHALSLMGAIINSGWLEFVSIQFMTFEEVSLLINSDDRVVWRFAQDNQMILLTANRSRKGKNSLELVMSEENTFTSLPVITIGNPDRLLNEFDYRQHCINRLIEIVLDIERYKGSMRIYIP